MRLGHQAILAIPMENANVNTIMMDISAIVVKLDISSPRSPIPRFVKVFSYFCMIINQRVIKLILDFYRLRV